MRKRKTFPLILLGVGLILIGGGLGIKLLESAPSRGNLDNGIQQRSCVQPAPVSFDAPQLSLQDIEGLPVTLEAYLGKVVLLNAWATWCPPCLAELPDLEAYFNGHSNNDFVLIGVNIGERQKTVIEFLEQNRISFPIWLDPTEETLRALNTISLPHSIVIDRAGVVRLAWSGATCLENLEAVVTPILRQD